ncbi:CDP-2,3-bis-(O-geranylgeranyl)-sn-glycerol synthase [Methanosarcinales archaeon]|nr:MAG: CDP-2,3-bis-(O-geranylgeranyl)-sn-glycerol synthase [Methanosarcinales archaeon]
MFDIILTALWLMLPAYLPNPCAATFGQGTVIDFGRNFIDGRRIFGDGKTYIGFLAGTAAGIMVGLIQMIIAPYFPFFPVFDVKAVFCLSIGSLLGDLGMSFLKRRIGLARGAPFPIADQLDFVAGAWMLTYLFEREWFVSNFTAEIVITVLIITPIMHLITNIIGYKLGKKEVPW